MNKLGKSLAVFNWASQRAEKDLVHTISKEKLQDHYEIMDEIGRGVYMCVYYVFTMCLCVCAVVLEPVVHLVLQY
jgi:succinate-acetate transporter protein